MADIQYKKGELLFSGDITTTSKTQDNTGTSSISKQLTQNILIIDFNGVEYTCEANDVGWTNVYGGFSQAGPDFLNYPFTTYEQEGNLILITENPGTYTLKVYTAIEDTDSTPLSPTDFIIAYLMASPQNSNWNVLSTLLGDGDWSQLKAYVETTPKNMNRQVLRVLLGSGSSGSSAVVGTAVVGTDTVG